MKNSRFWSQSLLTLIFINLFITLTLNIGCTSYVSKIHQKLDDDEKTKNGPLKVDKFGMFKQKPGLMSSQNTKVLLPPVERQYQEEGAKKRYMAEDLNDNSNEGSLWYGYGQENFLFSKNKTRRPGDIIIIKVMENLKKEIALELARAFPLSKNSKDKDKDKKVDTTNNATPPAVAGATKEEKKEETANDKGVYDHISAVIAEDIGKDHLLLKGRKDVLYRNRKRLIEVQAMITTRDIQDDDTINSLNIIESSVAVLR